MIWTGARDAVHWNQKTILTWLSFYVWLVIVIWGPRMNLGVLIHVAGNWFGHGHFGLWMNQNIARWFQLLAFFILPFLAWLFAKGLRTWARNTKYQNRLAYLGLKTQTGVSPKIAKVVDLENTQKRILVHAAGLDVASFKEKKGVIESGFNAIVQDIKVCSSNRQMVEILIADKELTSLVSFDENQEKLNRPYTFMVGESLRDFIVADLCEIHHLIVAGSTGGGKSVFFKQALIGVLKSSEHIQLYLVDLKRGVELKPFSVLKNVRLAKDELSAVSILQLVVAEMESRFKYLEEKGFNEIVSKRDGLDRIVIAIDEASVLFTVGKMSKEAKAIAETSRELTDKIAKLGRAAGIHLILATQKVVKETIDTRVQANINAKICFRVNSIGASSTVLGNKKAFELPDIKGRGIWSVGSNDVVVQVPYLSPDAINAEIETLKEKFNGETSPVLKPMLHASAPVKERSQKLEIKESKLALVKGSNEAKEN